MSRISRVYLFIQLLLVNLLISPFSLSYDDIASDEDPHCIQATSRLLNKDVILNCLRMANTEMKEVNG